ncbi:MAG: electron transfer flavoprotein subunit alpha/FixB family protein [Oscillospiraceae bacterium]|nr:electron transfer flavoprotein subunit alpha/FixB family protein [Oscillospiraceae bacterium]
MELRLNKKAMEPDVAKTLIELCPFSAFEYENGVLIINAACRMCSLCVKKGPPGAVTLEQPAKGTLDKTLWRGVVVFAERRGSGLHPVTFELLAKARELASEIDHPVIALLLGKGIADLSEELCHYGPDEVYYYDYAELEDYLAQPYTAAFCDFIRRFTPCCVLVGATSLGRSLAPRVAARFKTGITADCTKLTMNKNTDLVQIRPAFGGNIMAEILTTSARPQLCTVRYKVFDAAKRSDKPSAKAVGLTIDEKLLATDCKVQRTELKPAFTDIADAEIIVAAGRGVRNKEDMGLVEELASLLGAQLACTRPLVENGWIDARRQIGLSGRTVKPKLIITCGISGSIQFAAGMSGAERIVAVNRDPEAQIFKIAHYSVVGDLYEILPELITAIKEAQSAGA